MSLGAKRPRCELILLHSLFCRENVTNHILRDTKTNSSETCGSDWIGRKTTVVTDRKSEWDKVDRETENKTFQWTVHVAF